MWYILLITIRILCLECGSETINPKYCSKSCSVTANNRLKPKRKAGSFPCKGNCGNTVSRPDGRFCSDECRRQFKYDTYITNWLKTVNFANKSTTPHQVRHYLLMDQGGVCSICKMKPFWNGSELSFISDHIDGNATNNQRDNLRMICPNCDSQTPTFKSRNRGNGRRKRKTRY